MSANPATRLERARELRDDLAVLEAAILGDVDAGATTVAAAARALGVERQTIYNRLAHRQDRRDQLGHTETPPAEEAPADTDTPENA